ncbi:EAL domain-containing protein [Notoacmeibacter sp. MSK16QG-6]|uniref:GGDEF/EAL domain-containing response regulator n=1 Tax=Notoacmeibacter sp. MSK16QG-6 TaxID=2957982 RepID=UPI0020A11BD5|nr:EAL domain-containing protein [Notoacmeibacter sp. MSK16QG-6]MCP1200217.1 EAL domain-containing protein [Notoacmeibacter sp. MSK16QG-6]
MPAKQSYRILLADAERDRMLVVREALGELNRTSLAVKTCHSAGAMIGLLKTGNFDLILAAADLPGCSGAELLRWMKVQVKQVPVVLIAPEWLAAEEAEYSGAADLLHHGELTAPILDRAIRYAVYGHDRQAMTMSVLENTEAAIAVIDSDNRVKMANSAFWSAAAQSAASAGRFQSDVLLAKVLRNETGQIHVGERVFESRIVDLPHDFRSIVLVDVTRHAMALEERRDTERRITYLATHDPLTGLPNRLGFSGEINKRIRSAKLEEREFYLITFDLKRFKEINDVFGHATGDGLLKCVAKRMRECLRENEYLARLGGDEFVVLQPKTTDDDDKLPSSVRRVLNACDQSFSVKKKLINVSLSAGISIYPSHGKTAEELQANAGCAISRIKQNPLERVCTFDENMDRALRKRRTLAADLQKALEEKAIEVHFQPKAEVADCRLTGFEALARWTHPELGPISPVEFISIAEEYGMIIELGRCLMEKACSIACDWPDNLHLAINVSPVQIIHTDLVETVRETLLTTGFNAKRLEIEITESLLIGDTERTLDVLRKLRAMDISIAMDDFGTGYSSLSALMAFPFDTLKIDRTFIEKITHNPQAYEIVRSVIGLGRMMDFKVVAEGVDMQSHIDFLREHGCSEMQGFLLGKPMPADQAARLIEAGPVLEYEALPDREARAA